MPELNILVNSAGMEGLPERTLNEKGIEIHLSTNYVGHWLFANLRFSNFTKSSENGPKGATRVVNISPGSLRKSAMRFSDVNLEKMNKDLPAAEQPSYRFFELWGCMNAEEEDDVPLDGYNRSKVTTVLFGICANKRWFEKHGIVTFAVHPGCIQTELVRNFATNVLEAVDEMRKTEVYNLKTLGTGSSTTLVASSDTKLAVGVGETVEEHENYGAFLMDCQTADIAHPLAV